jgi:hypothetical protein
MVEVDCLLPIARDTSTLANDILVYRPSAPLVSCYCSILVADDTRTSASDIALFLVKSLLMVSSTASFNAADGTTILHSETTDHLCCSLGGQQGYFYVDEEK